jgi:hypothetical protein
METAFEILQYTGTEYGVLRYDESKFNPTSAKCRKIRPSQKCSICEYMWHLLAFYLNYKVMIYLMRTLLQLKFLGGVYTGAERSIEGGLAP